MQRAEIWAADEAGVRNLVLRIARHRFRAQVSLDAGAWAFALMFAVAARYDFDTSRIQFGGLATMIALAAVCQIGSGVVAGIYLGRWRFGSFEEVAVVARSAMATTALLFVLNVWLIPGRQVPLSTVPAGGVAALLLMSATRYLWRGSMERRERVSAEGRQSTIIFGAGESGAQVVRAMLRDWDSPYFPVALLDDDPYKQALTIMGVAVSGNRFRIKALAQRTRAQVLLIAIPSAGSRVIREVTAAGRAAGLEVKVLPPAAELFGSPVELGDIRSVRDSDLLGRREVEVDLSLISNYLAGKRVLVTGAGGSIGSELCRQLHALGVLDQLTMTDRDESALHAVELELDGRALLDSPNLVLLDIRDERGVDRLFRDHRPDVVFHAAALKHLPLLERYPCEALQSNVWATQHVLDAALRHDVDRFVNISTDKAADPTSVLGFSKRIAERLTAHAAERANRVYLSVRFGNVLGSRGSALVAFRAQIESGGPVTVTHPDVTRYFMTVGEAVRLVIQSAAIGRQGEVLVLDMGEPVRIADIAQHLVERAAQPPVDIVFTGLRPGEKLHEQLFATGEWGDRAVHPLVTHVGVPPLDPSVVALVDPSAPANELRATMESLCRADAAFANGNGGRETERETQVATGR